MSDDIITSPTLDTESGIVTSVKDFSGKLTLDLTDDEIKRAMVIVTRVKRKWQERFRSKFSDPNLSFSLDEAMDLVTQFEDEIKTELAEKVNVLATVDPIPVLEGKPLVIEWIGKLPGDDIYKYGMDHERKETQVKKATQRGEDFLGQKDSYHKNS